MDNTRAQVKDAHLFPLQGTTVGPALANALGDTYNGMWVQGVGEAYTATFPPNLLPAGTTQDAIDEAKNLFTRAHDKCPDSVVLAGGYRYVVTSSRLSRLTRFCI